MKPLCIDLCCGSGGWAEGFIAEGWDVIGYDIEDQAAHYPGQFRRGDVRDLTVPIFGASVVVASPPCEEFSRHQMPWTRRRNPPLPDMSIAVACWRYAGIVETPIVMENVRAAQPFFKPFFGPAKWHCGSFYLWGDVPALMPDVIHRKKESYGSKDRLKRARVPIDLARWIARCFTPARFAATGSMPLSASTAAPTVKVMACEIDA